MSVIQARTREQLRLGVGDNLGAVSVRTATANGSATTIVDVALGGSNDDFIGYWIVFTLGDNDGRVRLVTDYVGSSGTLTISATGTALTSTVSGDTFELWEEPYPPARLHRQLNEALIEATGRAFDPFEDATSLWGDGRQRRFDLPTGVSLINRLERRSSVAAKTVHDCERLFDETADANFTQSTDTEDYKRQSALRAVIAAGASAGDIITDSITSLDLQGYSHLEFWIKCTIATTAADFKIHLGDSTVTAANAEESLDVPALVANTWTHVKASFASPDDLDAIISVGLEYDADIGACTVWLDNLVAVQRDTEDWEKIPSHLWRLDVSARDLVLVNGGHSFVGNSPIKIIGGDKPAMLSTAESSAGESSASEVADSFVIARTTQLALMAASGGQRTDPEERRALGAYWATRAEREYNSLPIVNGRAIS